MRFEPGTERVTAFASSIEAEDVRTLRRFVAGPTLFAADHQICYDRSFVTPYDGRFADRGRSPRGNDSRNIWFIHPMSKYLNTFRLDGRVALVTGGARGLGRIIAETLAEAGASVALTARSGESAAKAAGEIAAQFGAKTLGLAADVVKALDVEKAVADTVAAFGPVDVLVNNAGINIRGPIETLGEDDWDAVIDTNLKGAWLGCRAVVPSMKKRRWGRILNLSSMMASISMADRTPYSASKGGMSAMTKSLSLELAPFGVTVNNLCPGPFATEINTPLLSDPDVNARVVGKIPMARWGRPEELGPIALFLCSEASSFVTGADFTIDGGYTAQ